MESATDYGEKVTGFDVLNSKILQERLHSLGWTTYRLAQEVAKIRQANGREVQNFKRLIPGIEGCLDNPERSQLRNVNDIVAALGGEHWIKWKTEVIEIRVEEVEEKL